MKKSKIKNLKKRHGKESRFQFLGILAIGFSLAFLVILFSMILSKSGSAFLQTKIALEIDLSPTAIYSQVDEVDSTESNPNYRRLIKQALRQKFPDAASLVEISSLYQML